MSNSEKFVIFPGTQPGAFINKVQAWEGTIPEAKRFAAAHGFKGGVEVAERIAGRLTFSRV